MKRFCVFVFCYLFLICYCKGQNNEVLFDKYNNPRYNTLICDFDFVTALDTNTCQNLYSLKADSIYVFFYDPFCEHCHREIKLLKKNKQLNKAIKDSSLVILSIAPDIDYNTWQKYVKKMPKQWLNAYSFENEKIIKTLLWKVPELFVLDRQKRIVHIDMYRQDLEDE